MWHPKNSNQTGDPVPVTIAGVDYPSLAQAIKATGLTMYVIRKARKSGTLDKLVPDLLKAASNEKQRIKDIKEARKAYYERQAQAAIDNEISRQEAERRAGPISQEHHRQAIFSLTNELERYKAQCLEYEITLGTLLKLTNPRESS